MAAGDRLNENDNRDWRITFPDATVKTVSAVYPTADENLPGWTLLKDHRHKIVLMVRDERALHIERLDDEGDTTP